MNRANISETTLTCQYPFWCISSVHILCVGTDIVTNLTHTVNRESNTSIKPATNTRNPSIFSLKKAKENTFLQNYKFKRKG
ncbi:hypothetical protein HanRHA438_Chr17g0813851 [Helianthus annuus]|nr:hypothetical protein HanRHA438_Chr17g0813851 [Helianthus annuus]